MGSESEYKGDSSFKSRHGPSPLLPWSRSSVGGHGDVGDGSAARARAKVSCSGNSLGFGCNWLTNNQRLAKKHLLYLSFQVYYMRGLSNGVFFVLNFCCR